jgi:DNA polymerase III delta prime subunit
MNDFKLTNIPSMPLNKLIVNLSNGYCSVINRGLPVGMMPPIMLWGPSGIGKTQVIRQLAEEIQDQTGKRCVITDVLSLLVNRVELDSMLLDDSEDTVNILAVDGISSMPQFVQTAGCHMITNRMIGNRNLPENCMIIATGNRTNEQSAVPELPKFVANRMLHIEVECSFESWKQWAIASGIHAKVIGFLSFHQDFLMRSDDSSNDLAFPTPRSWELVSNLLNAVDDDLDRIHPMIAGLIGNGVAVEFRSWSKIYAQLPALEDIFEGKSPKLPAYTDAMCALTSAMTTYARAHKDDLEQIAHSIRYAVQMPSEFLNVLLKNYMSIEKGYREKLMQIPEFAQRISNKGSLMSNVN